MKLRKICAHPIWFLIGSILFAGRGIRLLLIGDLAGGVIYLIATALFLIGFIGQVKFNKKK